jgi:diguanylate cyclase (GGDEF)-like protein
MFDPAADPRWLRHLGDLSLRLGFVRALLLASTALLLLALALAALALPWLSPAARPGAMWVTAAVMLVVAPLLSACVLTLALRLDAVRQHSSGQATHDELTGAHNRRHFLRVAEREWARCRRYNEDAALLLFVADHFKVLRERHGAARCDALLRDITTLAMRMLRQPDLLARYGGEALVVYLPNTDPLGALDVAERIREAVAAHRLGGSGSDIGTTVSVGVASAGAAHTSLQALVQDARAALQVARQAGQNCVRAAPIQPRAAPARPLPAALRGRRQ